jgi:hypothetical protein
MERCWGGGSQEEEGRREEEEVSLADSIVGGSAQWTISSPPQTLPTGGAEATGEAWDAHCWRQGQAPMCLLATPPRSDTADGLQAARGLASDRRARCEASHRVACACACAVLKLASCTSAKEAVIRRAWRPSFDLYALFTFKKLSFNKEEKQVRLARPSD